MQNTTGKMMEWIVARKLAQDLERRNAIPPTTKRVQNRKNHLDKRSQIRIRFLQRIPEEGKNSGRGVRSGRCVQQSTNQTADGTPCAIWHQLDAHKMARSSTPGKKGCHATWKLDFHAQQLTMGLPQGSPCPQSSTMSTQRDWQIRTALV